MMNKRMKLDFKSGFLVGWLSGIFVTAFIIQAVDSGWIR